MSLGRRRQRQHTVNYRLQLSLADQLQHSAEVGLRGAEGSQNRGLLGEQRPQVGFSPASGGRTACHQSPADGQCGYTVFPGVRAYMLNHYIHAASLGQPADGAGKAGLLGVIDRLIGPQAAGASQFVVGAGGGDDMRAQVFA